MRNDALTTTRTPGNKYGQEKVLEARDHSRDELYYGNVESTFFQDLVSRYSYDDNRTKQGLRITIR